MSINGDVQQDHPLLSIFADVGVKIGNLHKQLKDDLNWRKMARASSAPVLYRQSWSGVCNASGFGTFANIAQVDGPDQGHIWYVRRISVLGATVGATVASGRYDVFISASDFPNFYNNINQFPPGEWQDGSTTIPNNAFYSRGAMPLRMNESLAFVVSGAPANQVITGQFVIEDFEEAALRQDWAM